ncbi:MAG: Phosphoesterase RecJ domain protein [Berkelbacteria bacterium GW2011_GWB1_38_5]|uniref:Phosphoesterase RecJ domain protein n=1 Tax=Berkelbacteria bacterium GW2011_GWB1_38_5 TaxID=1618336 RepID=A0A0G0K581_9BACT|nr:MAG: Phosphoesterase RecJ domain protein [Berkelbacteria bacterium GW2011_GWB1_38_5]
MELTSKQQTTEQIKSAQKILVLTHVNPDGDGLGSLLACYLVLKKLGKDVTAVAPETLPMALKFLPNTKDLVTNYNSTKDFIISIDTSNTKVDRLGYRHITEENKLNIVVTPLSGTFKDEDVTFSYGTYKFDLIIVLDSPDLERLGPLYDGQTALFYETPVINIDHHAGNDFFGKINWVDLTSTSTAEILVSLIESLSREMPLIDEDVATALLTGIITDTGSFQNANTTPKSLTVAAQLVAAGGRQQEIIRHVFKTKPLSTLRLWGRILEQVQSDLDGRFIWSKISRNDLAAVSAEDSQTGGVIDELLKSAPEIDFAMLLVERQNLLHGSLRAVAPGIDVASIARLFGGGGHEAAAAFQIPGATLADKEGEILAKIREYQRSKA